MRFRSGGPNESFRGMPAGDPTVWRRLRRRLYWGLLVTVLRLAAVLPLRVGRKLGEGLARLAARIRPQDLAQADANLQLAFPELEDHQRRRLLAATVRAAGQNLFDTLAVGRLLERSDQVVEEGHPDTGHRPVRDVIAELRRGGRGVLVLGGHLGCWELLGAWLGAGVRSAAGARDEDLPLAVVTGTVHNAPVDRLLQARRRALGLTVLPRDGGLRPLVRHLRQGGVAAVLLDQYTRVQNMSVPFFGHPAPTPVGFARLALRYGVPVLPVGIGFDTRRRVHVVRHLAPLYPAGWPDDEAGLRGFLTACNEALETLIRRNPEQWVWFHRRWPQGPAGQSGKVTETT